MCMTGPLSHVAALFVRHHNMNPTLSEPALCSRSVGGGGGTVQRVSDSRPPSSPSCGSDWVGANAEGQVESCSRGRSAGVSPVSLPQRALVDAA